MVTLTGTVHVAARREELFDRLAEVLMGAARRAVEQRGVFHLALSGGSTPEPFYHHLVMDPTYRIFPWEKTHLWMVDERRVPDNDDRNNFRMIRESLADHVPIEQGQLHPMPVMADDPAALYEEQLREQFGGDDIPRLDFILLGMGDDGHTASLFPHSPALNVTDRWVAVNEGDAVTPPGRVTMTYPLLNAARQLAVLVTGAKKADTLRRIEREQASGHATKDAMPILGIQPERGIMAWYLDAEATGSGI